MIYRLLSGKISRPNAAGAMEIHKSPYDFSPTPGELAANKWRMQLISSEDAPTTTAAAAKVSATIQPAAVGIQFTVDDVRKVSVRAAVNYISNITVESELDRIFLQECDNKPKIRRSIVDAIEERRMKIKKTILPQLAAMEDISASESTTAS